jgi:hypothetical protein
MSNFTTLYPALLFPAIPLMMISFGNRYTSLASLIRKIHDLIVLNKHSKKTAGHYFDQITILTKRLIFSIAILMFIYEIQLSTRALSKHLEDLKDLT